MAATFDQVAADAANLNDQDRVRLLEFLLDRVPQPDDGAPLGATWEEVRERIKAMDDGAVTLDAFEAIEEIRRELHEGSSH